MNEALPALVIVLLISMCVSCDFGDPVPMGKPVCKSDSMKRC